LIKTTDIQIIEPETVFIMAQEEITLFDLPSKDRNACWSPNPWKGTQVYHIPLVPLVHTPKLISFLARLVLNFKKIDYKTVWLEYPAIEPTLKPQLGPSLPSLQH
jgi:hypothetical protein